MIINGEHLSKIKNIISSLTKMHNVNLNFAEYYQSDYFSWSQSMVINNKFFLPNLYKNIDSSKSTNIMFELRSSIDMACCYALYHDHDKYQNDIQYSSYPDIHNNFEKVRVLLIGAQLYFGFFYNITNNIKDHIFYCSEIDLLPIIILDSFYPDLFDKEKKEYISNFRQNNYPAKIINLINELIFYIHNQELYFKKVDDIIALINLQNSKERSVDNNSLRSQENRKNIIKEEDSKNNDEHNLDIETLNYKQNRADQMLDNILESKKDDLNNIAENDNKDNKEKISVASQSLKSIQSKNNGIEFVQHYKIYTTKFDQVIIPQKIVKKSELIKLKEQLDEKSKNIGKISNSQIVNFKKKLTAKKDEFLEVGSIEGVINRKKLTQLIINPLTKNILINKKLYQANNVAVTILLDNSGSMRGKPIMISALACQTLAKLLEEFGIKTEIIGYTTGDWKGGRVKRQWEESGKIKNPGRLNELRHIIYKDFRHSFKRSNINLALMLKEGLLKENIDGEAILFAAKRLEKRVEQKKIMLIISDGNPIDDATNSNNENDILNDHLELTVKNIEKRSKINIAAIKIGYSNNNFYHNFVTIKDVDEVGDVMLSKLAEII
jgi:cobaltochelatase CobT